MKEAVLIIAVVSSAQSKAQDTGKSGGIFSKSPTQAYSDGWDRVFGKKEAEIVSPDKKALN